MKKNQKYLIICHDNLGDLVFSSALCQSIAETHPDAKIDLWCKAYGRSIAKQYPHIHEVFLSDPFWDRAPGHAKGSFWAFMFVYFRILFGRAYTTIFVTSPNWRSAFFARWIRGEHRLGFTTAKGKRFLHHSIPLDSNKPIVESLGTLSKMAGLIPVKEYSLIPSPDAKKLAQRILVLHPFCGSLKRALDFGTMAFLIESFLVSQPYPLFILGSEKERLNFMSQYLKESTRTRVKEMSLEDLTKVQPESIFCFIGHDSGPLHLANALGISVFGLYLPGTYQRTMPQGPGKKKWIVKNHPSELSPEELISNLLDYFKELQKSS